ncbi:MAG: cryptochrome/photolyase family protein [Actinomycetales bacterium]
MPTDRPRSVFWFRRDLRLDDNPALLHAGRVGREVLPLFVLDPALWQPAGETRRAYLAGSLRSLNDDLVARLGAPLHVREGDPVDVVARMAQEVGADEVHIAADYGPYGRQRDKKVERALHTQDIGLVRTGSPYAVAPGRVTKQDGEPFRVFSPFARAWRDHGWRAPAPAANKDNVALIETRGNKRLPDVKVPEGMSLPPAGEAAARARWASFVDDGQLRHYDENRNRPDLDGTTQLSHHLKWGEIHPRTLLADLGQHRGKGVESLRNELAWREFYADVLWHRPETAREYYRPELGRMEFDEPDDRFAAWQEGRTGYPIVDAGMRQLRAVGWVHNRVRMIVASFLVKDLHVEWQHGAREFMLWLRDGDLASNSHGWQWVAGTGTDAAPYFRVFNPVSQGLKFDPDGDYVRRYVPELRGVEGAAAHEPWTVPSGLPQGYPERIVDHAAERREALSRYEAAKR